MCLYINIHLKPKPFYFNAAHIKKYFILCYGTHCLAKAFVAKDEQNLFSFEKSAILIPNDCTEKEKYKLPNSSIFEE